MGNINEDHLIRGLKKVENVLQREVNYTLYTRDEFKKKKAKKDSFILDIIENPKVFLVGGRDEL